MAGFLDKQERIVDLVLTSEGKRLLSTGELNFTYWKAFDDEVDYSPILMNSGSLNEAALSSSIDEKIEDTLVREATTGYRMHNHVGKDETNVHRPLFTAPVGKQIVPRMTQVSGSDVADILVNQRRVQEIITRKTGDETVDRIGPIDRGFQREISSIVPIDFDYHQLGFPKEFHTEGFLIRVFKSGSGGFVEVDEKIDSNGDVVFSEDLVMDVKK